MRSSEIQSCQISDVAAIVSNSYVGPVSFKECLDDEGPTIHIVMLSKKLIPLANEAEMIHIDGVFKIVANLQVVLLGIRSKGNFDLLLLLNKLSLLISTYEWNIIPLDCFSLYKSEDRKKLSKMV